ncbi:MAG: ATP-binding protein [Ilumatobacteraceae bacterium]
MPELSLDDARALVGAIVDLSHMADRAIPPRTSPLAARLQAHLAIGTDAISSTSATLPLMERVNVQLALDAYERDAAVWEVIGLTTDIGNYGGVSLPGMVSGSWQGPGESSRQYEAVEVDVDETLACLKSGIVLTEHDGVPVAVLLYVADRYAREVIVEIVGSTQEAADGFLRRLRHLMDEHNAFRGKVISFSFGMHGQFGMTFTRVPFVDRGQVVLRAGELDAIEEHTIGISEVAAELRAAGQHVKRGLLLYGPPGTGKTHTISYLLSRMAGRTTIILTGGAVSAVGQAGTIARQLQPATIVIEDVDLIGMDRQLPGGEHNALLFQLLNEMDGLAEDADVLFVLTTNRVDMLEPALAARPGRVDQAIELALPDAEGRRRLLELYTGVPVTAADEDVVAQLDGVAPAFIKELARRAALVRLRDGATTGTALATALDTMLEHATPVLRRTLAGPTTTYL